MAKSNKNELAAESISLAKLESIIAELKETKLKLQNEIQSFEHIEQEKKKKIIELQNARQRVECTVDAKSTTKIPDISGNWRGATGQLLLTSSGNNISGAYDWGATKNIGYIKGYYQNRIVKFEWKWQKRPPSTGEGGFHPGRSRGNGYFFVEDGGKILNGAFFFSYDNISLDAAIAGQHDEKINPWVFFREPSG